MRSRRTLRQPFMSLAGLALIVAGIPIFVTPVPLGAVMVVSGAVLLLRASPRARWLRRAAWRRYPGLSGRIARWRDGVRQRYRV